MIGIEQWREEAAVAEGRRRRMEMAGANLYDGRRPDVGDLKRDRILRHLKRMGCLSGAQIEETFGSANTDVNRLIKKGLIKRSGCKNWGYYYEIS